MRVAHRLATVQCLALAGALILFACGGGGGSKSSGNAVTPIVSGSITLLGVPADVNVADSLQITAQDTVPNDTVVWTVDGVVNGNAEVGTIQGSGTSVTYIAPAAEGTHVIVATSSKDSTKAASGQLRIHRSAAISTMTLSPASLTLNLGGQKQFTVAVTGTGSFNSAVTWTAQRGSISSSGLYTAPSTSGSDVVTATSVQDSTKSATSNITVAVGTSITGVTLSPASFTLNTGGQNQFTASVTGTGTFSTAVTWTAQRGSVSSTGLYTAPSTSGSDVVTATSVQDSTKSATSSITVAVGTSISAVALSPASLSLITGGQKQFTATVTGTGSFSTAVTWTAQRGSISSTGLYTAPSTSGSDVVTATSVQDSIKSATSSITVAVGTSISAVALSPASFTLNTGAQNQFTATVTGTGSFSTAVTWTAQRGSVSSSGLYTAPSTSGSDVVTATSVQDSTKSATSSITVAVGTSITAVTLSPASLSLNTGGQKQFTATVTGTGTFSTAVTWAAQRGSVSSSGLYTAPSTSGSDVVTATSVQDSTKSATSSITVAVGTSITGVTLSPASFSLNSGGQNQFTATVTGTGSFSTAVTWTAQRGSVSSTGLYTAPSTSGTDVVTATSVQDSTKSATSSITVAVSTSISAVALSPASLSLSTGGQKQFTAGVTGTGSFSTAVTWTAQRGSISSTGLYTAPSTSGTDVVTATSVQDSTKSATSNITVVAISISAVTLSPASLSLNTGGLNQFTATVTGSGSFSSAVTWTAQRGSVSSTGLYTAPSTSGTDVVTASSVQDTTKSATASVTVLAVVAGSGIIVSPTGLQGNPGTLAAPTTLEGAQALIQKAITAKSGSLTVLLRGGVYQRSASLTLGAADSGTAAAPVQWAAYPGEQPRLVGGVSLPVSALQPVTSADPNWSRLDANTRSLIYVADLSAYKASLGSFASRHSSVQSGGTNQAMEVFANGVPLTLARYPKAVDPKLVNLSIQASIVVSGSVTPDVTGTYAYAGLDASGRAHYQLTKGGTTWTIGADPGGPQWQISNAAGSVYFGAYDNLAGPVGRFEGVVGASGLAYATPADGSAPLPGLMLIQGSNGASQITVSTPEMSKWNASEAMYYGLSYWSWWGDHCAISSFNPSTGTISLANAPTLGSRTGQPFFIYNLLEELTAPGDYFIDRVNARLYMRPLGDVLPTEVILSTLQTPIVQMAGCTGITWQGISFEADKDLAISATNCQSVSFNTCQFWNSGGYGLVLSGSSNVVEACDFRQLGQGGVSTWGGNRSTLTPSGTLIENCQFQSFGRLFWTYQPAIQILQDNDYNPLCMGITVQHNEIHSGPHDAIIYSGSSHTIQYNKIYDVDQFTSDAGAIYTSGCEWGTQGNQIKNNLIFNCGGPLGGFISGIYIDGGGSGVDIEGNILYKSGQLCGIQHNGGRDVQTRYNISYGHWYGIDISNVIFSINNNSSGSQTNFLQKLQYYNYQSAPWSTAYPNLAVIPNTYAQLPGSHWLEPENSVCYGNLQFGGSTDAYRQTSNYAPSMGAITTFFTQVGSNISQNPLFTNPANLDFSLQSGSPMFAIPGFPGINTALIGIQK